MFGIQCHITACFVFLKDIKYMFTSVVLKLTGPLKGTEDALREKNSFLPTSVIGLERTDSTV